MPRRLLGFFCASLSVTEPLYRLTWSTPETLNNFCFSWFCCFGEFSFVSNGICEDFFPRCFCLLLFSRCVLVVCRLCFVMPCIH